ncbi:26878_t:CDS:2, partial [Racocetra persica]
STIDRTNTDHKALPSKIVEVFQMICIVLFIELENIPTISVGVHEAELAQSASTI